MHVCTIIPVLDCVLNILKFETTVVHIQSEVTKGPEGDLVRAIRYHLVSS